MDFKFDFDVIKNKGVIISEDLDIIREYFSIEDTGLNFARRRRNKHAKPIRTYAITPTGRFNIGLFGEIQKYLHSLQYPINIITTNKFDNRYKLPYTFQKTINLKLSPYNYQTEALNACYNQGNGVIEIGTGGGKTLTMAYLIENARINSGNQYKALVVVPNIQLVQQTYMRFIEYGIDKEVISKYSGKNEISEGAQIIICSMQILASKKQDNDWIKDIDLLICDEAHILKRNNKICKLIERIETPHKFGFTGTLPESKIDEWNVYGLLGPHLYKKTSDELRKEKFLSNLSIYILHLMHITFPPYHEIEDLPNEERLKLNATAKWELENEFVYLNEWRNLTISKICDKINGNSLVLVDRIKHGETLKDIFDNNIKNKQIYFIQGSVDVDDREYIRQLMECENNIICIAMSKIFSTGIDIKNLPYIVFALAGKAKVRVIQSIGRGLRLHQDKIKLIIFDIADNFIYSQRQLEKRKALYDKEHIKYFERKINE